MSENLIEFVEQLKGQELQPYQRDMVKWLENSGVSKAIVFRPRRWGRTLEQMMRQKYREYEQAMIKAALTGDAVKVDWEDNTIKITTVPKELIHE